MDADPQRSTSRGGGDGFCELYRSERRFVARVVRRFGVPRPDVDDAVQEVFLVLYRRWRELRSHAPIRPWLYGVARRVSGNYRRTKSRRRARSLSSLESSTEHALVDAQDPPADERLALAQAWSRLSSELRKLHPARQLVFALVEFEHMTSNEVARIVRRSPNTVSSRLRLARRELRERLSGVRL
jgi:RNA polymerase sigma-70 factor (ECF subfamily)